ncbi:hypothetical protein pb186bvf_002272 [Paramecium bursaria]
MRQNSLLSTSYLSQDLAERSDAEIYAINSNLRYKTIRNNFIFVMILNILCLIGNTFSMSFYEWYRINVSTQEKDVYYAMWLNLLYMYDPQLKKYLSFQQYRYSQYNICKKNFPQDSANLLKCQNDFRILMYIGFFCFLCILCSQCFLIYDIVRLNNILKKIKKQEKSTSRIKGKIVYTIIITGQLLALLLYFFCVVFMGNLGLSGRLFGASYWVSMTCALCMIAFAFYYKWSKARYQRFLIMEKLVSQELSQESLGMVLEIQNNDL